MSTLRNWLSLIILAFIWGSSFILIKRGLFAPDGSQLYSSTQVGALRIVIAALVMLPFSLARLKHLRGKKVLYLLMVGLFGNAIPAFLFAKAQTEISSALAGMLNSLVPLFSLIIAFFIFKVQVRSWQVIGLFLGLISAIGIIYFATGSVGSGSDPFYAGLVVIATLCYAISLNTIKQFLQNEPAVGITGLALLLVSPIGVLLLIQTDFIGTLTTLEGAYYGLGAISILAIIGTALALIIFNKLVQDTNTIFASSVTYLIPLVAIIWGFADGETMNFIQIIFAGTMLAGIFLINRK